MNEFAATALPAASNDRRAVQEIRFGAGGNDGPYLGVGWSGDESGFRWMVGLRSELWLEHPGPGTAYVLDLSVHPFIAATVPHQTLVIRARGHEVLRVELQAGGAVGCIIPAELLAAPGPVCLTFEHPDATAPRDCGDGGDDRMLALSANDLRLTPIADAITGAVAAGSFGIGERAVETLTGMSAERLMLAFESLGDNCEFGLVQRRCGAEPLSLLRFANIQLPALLPALHERFGRIGTPERIRCELGEGGFGPGEIGQGEIGQGEIGPGEIGPGEIGQGNTAVHKRREYVVQDDSYGITYHTFQYEGDIDQAELQAKQPTRQRFLARKLLEDLEAGEKIFVLRRNPPLALWQALTVYAALRRYGRNRLLWVDVAGDGGAPGTVSEVLPGLYRGQLDRLAPDANAHDLSFEVWLQVLVNTWKLATVGQAARLTAADGNPV